MFSITPRDGSGAAAAGCQSVLPRRGRRRAGARDAAWATLPLGTAGAYAVDPTKSDIQRLLSKHSLRRRRPKETTQKARVRNCNPRKRQCDYCVHHIFYHRPTCSHGLTVDGMSGDDAGKLVPRPQRFAIYTLLSGEHLVNCEHSAIAEYPSAHNALKCRSRLSVAACNSDPLRTQCGAACNSDPLRSILPPRRPHAFQHPVSRAIYLPAVRLLGARAGPAAQRFSTRLCLDADPRQLARGEPRPAECAGAEQCGDGRRAAGGSDRRAAR